MFLQEEVRRGVGEIQISFQILECCFILFVPTETCPVLLDARKKELHLSVDLLRRKVEGGKMIVEDLNLLDGCWRLYFKCGRYLIKVSFNSSLTD